MPPKRVPGVSYADVRTYWKRYGCSPGPCYPIPDSICYSFDNVHGFIPSPGLVTLKVLIDHIALEMKLIEEKKKNEMLPAIDRNLAMTFGLMAAWDAYNARVDALDKHYNELSNAWGNSWDAWYIQHNQEFQAHLNLTYPNRAN